MISQYITVIDHMINQKITNSFNEIYLNIVISDSDLDSLREYYKGWTIERRLPGIVFTSNLISME